MVVSLIQEKINNILLKCQVLLETSQTTIHELGSLIETLQSTEEAVVPTAQCVRDMQMHQTKSLLSLVKNKYKIHVHLKMDNTTEISHVNTKGGHQILNLDQNYREHMRILSLKGAHSYCREPTRSPKTNSRLEEPEGNRDRFKQLESLQRDLNAEVKVYVSWKQDPIAVTTDALVIKWTVRQAYAFPPFC